MRSSRFVDLSRVSECCDHEQGGFVRVAGLKLFGRLDRYVLRLFLASYATAFFLVVGLMLVLDLASNLDNYLDVAEGERAATGMEIARFYALQIPFLFLGVSPFVTLIGGLFAGSRMSRTREIIAVVSSGVSVRRAYAMILAVGVLCSVGMFALREWVGEELAFERNLAHDRVSEHRESPVWEQFWVADESERRWRVGLFIPAQEDVPARLEGLVGRFRGAEGLLEVRADFGTWTGASWNFEGGRRISSGGHEQRVSELEGSAEFTVTPEDIALTLQERENALDLSFAQASRLLERTPGSRTLATVRQYHLTFPIAGVALLLVGLSFVALPRRGGGLERVGMGFLLCMGYFACDFVCRSLGMQGNIGPLYAAWVPLIVFGSLGVVLFGGVRT